MQQRIFRLNTVGVRQTAIYGADSSTLGFLVKSGAFGAFIRYDVVEII